MKTNTLRENKMPIKFSDLTKKNIDESTSLVGLYTNNGETENCLVPSKSITSKIDNLSESISSVNNKKADKTTTLKGYGITDSYTKSEVDTKITTAKNDLNKTINSKDANVVHNSGNETIGGAKTFTTSPIVPTPATTDNSTKVATTAWVNKKMDPTQEDETVLFRENINTGDITLSEPYTNFQYIDIYSSTDANDVMDWTRIPVRVFDRMMHYEGFANNSLGGVSIIGIGSCRWEVYTITSGKSSTTKLAKKYENCRIHMIYGINRKKS
jgi:hypothetical protein